VSVQEIHWRKAEQAAPSSPAGRLGEAASLRPVARADIVVLLPLPRSSSYLRIGKRFFDLAVALPLLLLVLPLLVVVAIAIRCDSKGPVFFRQHRLGYAGRTFAIWKFRTMRVLENGAHIEQARAGDPRITRIGRFLRMSSIDELPQLLNVLQGDMSVVGPRPHALAHDREYGARIAHYAARRAVKPGITGWAQVHGLRGPTFELDTMRRRVDHDVWYAQNASFALDIRILLHTVREILYPRNAV
jgi:exopolysaccharide biosynthesis polyprenyl glycosylphosphotransferase